MKKGIYLLQFYFIVDICVYEQHKYLRDFLLAHTCNTIMIVIN